MADMPARNEERLHRIDQFKQATHPSAEWNYSFRDVILYALSIGCRRTERQFVYENDKNFATLASFAVVAVHKARLEYQQLLPNFDMVSLCSSILDACINSSSAMHALLSSCVLTLRGIPSSALCS